MNIPLLRQIAAVIQQHPEKFNMKFWHSDETSYFGKLPNKSQSCGTSHCIAGWAHFLDGRFPRSLTMNAAPKILGITNSQALRLFHADNWPPDLGADVNADGDCEPTPAQSAARIERFIETGGAE